jgi:hypothetical protein
MVDGEMESEEEIKMRSEIKACERADGPTTHGSSQGNKNLGICMRTELRVER